jgi:hypothetical protein
VFLLLLLRQPRLRLIYVTSVPVASTIVEYYLALLPGVIPSHARARLHFVATYDGTSRPLSAKLLERPRILEHVRSLIPDPALCHLVPYATTTRERDIALALGFDVWVGSAFLPAWDEDGCRRLFGEERVPHPLGFADLRSLDDVIDALTQLRRARPTARRALVKLNEGVAGLGNALVDLERLPDPSASGARAELMARVESMALENEQITVASYLDDLLEGGGIVEERITGRAIRSPSVQLRVTPLGEVELLSTHDQLLGGATGQTFSLPLSRRPCLRTSDQCRGGQGRGTACARGRARSLCCRLRGRARRVRRVSPFAIELNLRKGGTTHPFLALQFLTGGAYDPVTALFTAPSGRQKHMVATDHLESPLLRGLTLDDLFDIVARHGPHFDQARQTGVVFNDERPDRAGRIGVTAVGDTAKQADETYRHAERVLSDEAALASASPTLPSGRGSDRDGAV